MEKDHGRCKKKKRHGPGAKGISISWRGAQACFGRCKETVLQWLLKIYQWQGCGKPGGCKGRKRKTRAMEKHQLGLIRQEVRTIRRKLNKYWKPPFDWE